MAHWLEDCQATIDTACGHHESINATQKELLENCSTIMNQFKERSEICQVNSMSMFECSTEIFFSTQNLTTTCSSCSCSCWQSLEADELNSVKGRRNVGRSKPQGLHCQKSEIYSKTFQPKIWRTASKLKPGCARLRSSTAARRKTRRWST